ncbi:MAG TPA: metalloregulator ArsR/SmtB family transcription factor [Gemmatimonadaceae bacterium]|nr:metalloregulator ArsR/SmtB family transcription factor [Gemmatimonadaceae bacterium]
MPLGATVNIFPNANMSTTRTLPVATATVADLDAVFKAFADSTRLRLLNVLAAGELCVCDLVELLDLAQPSVSRHLAVLRREGLVDAARDGRFMHYRLAAPVHDVHRSLIGCVRSCFAGVPLLDKERARAIARVRERAADPCA